MTNPTTLAQRQRARALWSAAAIALAVTGYPTAARAADPAQACVSIEENLARLACYDRENGRSGRTVTPPPVQAAGARAFTVPPITEPSLAAIWELDAAHKRGTFHLLSHQGNYLLPIRYSDRPNTTPGTPAPNHTVGAAIPVDATEAKFQFSAKFKAWENVFGDNGDIWFGYTQQSNWQLYNQTKGVSAAFRETNYEPEAILSLRTDRDVLGWRWRMLNLGFVHQSNGRALPLSRSWNRVYAQFGLERGDFTLLLRPWVRLPEKNNQDDNPDIRNYLGSGDVRVAYSRAGHVLSALGRYSVGGKRGALQVDWAFPISGSLKGYVQVFRGYGESLLDYNHSQTTLGVGLLLVPWQ